MKKIKHVLLVLALLVSVNAARAGTNDVGSLLQKGLFEEEANHNLDAAIQAYQAVVSQADKERRFEATAIFRLGECYRKQGKTNEANGQYSRIVKEFSDQTELAKLSESYVGTNGKAPSNFQDRLQSIVKKAEDATSGGSMEAQEMQRIQAMIQDSPDLINGRDGNVPLVEAVGRGQTTVVKFLLDNKADINAVDHGLSAINRATENGNKEMVELLLDRGANVNDIHSNQSDQYAPLHVAAVYGYKSIAEVLLAHKADVNIKTKSGLTPLHIASEKGFKAFAELLLANRADVAARDNSGATPLYSAIGSGNKPTVELLLAAKSDVNAKTQNGMTPLIKAAQSGQFEIARLLLEKGADVNAKCDSGVNTGWSPLHFALPGNRNDLVKLFLDSGAETNPKVSYSFTLPSGSSGQYQRIAPLSMAVVRGQKETVELLLGHKADVNAREDSDNTPLLWAVFQNQPEIAQLLLENGADVNAQNTGHESALSGAVGRRLPEMVKVLLSHKPTVEVLDNDGMTPLQRAVGYDHTNIVQQLLAAGANVDGRYNYPGYNHMTLLELAVTRHNKPMVELLLAHKANPNLQDDSGKTPLSYAKVDSNPGQPKSFDQLEQEKVLAAIESLLRQAGANDNLERLSQIRIGRKSSGFSRDIFSSGTNDYNNFTLLELIASTYRNADPGNNLAFPDFARVTINRLDAKTGTNTDIAVDLDAILASGDCSKDLWLQWGDEVEIPELDHKVNQPWGGISKTIHETLDKCLTRVVRIIVKGQTNTLRLSPNGNNAERDIQARLNKLRAQEAGIHAPATNNFSTISSCRLREVVYGAGVILASSDLSRVKVTRIDPSTKKTEAMVFDMEQPRSNLPPRSFPGQGLRPGPSMNPGSFAYNVNPNGQYNPQTDLWLRDCDVIEIPEKP